MPRTNGQRDAVRIRDGVSTFRGPLLPRDRSGPLPASLHKFAGFGLIATANAIEERYARAIADAGISLRDFVLLAEVALQPGLRQTTLAWRLGLGRSRVSEQLLVLDTAGYVSREIDALDLRKRMIWLSADAQRLVEECSQRLASIDNGWLNMLDRRERTDFTAALRRLPPGRVKPPPPFT